MYMYISIHVHLMYMYIVDIHVSALIISAECPVIFDHVESKKIGVHGVGKRHESIQQTVLGNYWLGVIGN